MGGGFYGRVGGWTNTMWHHCLAPMLFGWPPPSTGIHMRVEGEREGALQLLRGFQDKLERTAEEASLCKACEAEARGRMEHERNNQMMTYNGSGMARTMELCCGQR